MLIRYPRPCMDTLDDIISTIDGIRIDLAAPLSDASGKAGWTPGVQANWLEGLASVRQDLVAGVFSDSHSYNFARFLGMDAIEQGDLAERLAGVGNALMRFAAKQRG
jgi:hypothetical protein